MARVTSHSQPRIVSPSSSPDQFLTEPQAVPLVTPCSKQTYFLLRRHIRDFKVNSDGSKSQEEEEEEKGK
ncbi:hypothetical protein E2C01_038897 [Portunus trituberculatus]|uniref:Uncharacterized protein n=1 Tax=Portunus trituberculatus TaxID=210409 RepID=A0A5B7FI64_PORTR|nr:hypothetical protein [Portunus trituberculatus]